MGDFLSPKRRDVVDRLRKRIENYRRHHFGRAGGYENYNVGLGEHYRQDNLLPVLHQRWRESRAKKTTKAPKANKDNCSQNDPRNLIVTQKLKKKIDSSLPDQQGAGNNQSSADNVFNFDEQDSPQPPSGQSLGSENKIPRLSVSIVQKINNQQQEHSQTIQTNVTVKHYSEDSPQPGNNTTNTSIHTSVECKQEPVEEPQCRLYQQNQNNHQHQSQQQSSQAPGSNKSANSDIGFDDHNLDELSDILNNLDKVGGELPPDILKELDKFHEICVKVQQHSEGNDSRNMYSPLSSTSPGLGKGSFPDNMPPRGPINPVFEGNQNVNNVSNPLTTIHGPQSAPIADSAGPAASTLKQMAAQHQQNTPYGMKASAIDPFADPLSENFSRRQEYPAYSQHQSYGNIPQGQNSFPYNQNQSFQHMQNKPDIAGMNYGGTKPLTHFSDHNNQGSQPPLQQLQNQVRSQFNQSPNPQMQITQTQQMQVSHGQQRLHLSQTQQLQMQQAPQQISMSQQQSFSMQGHMNQPNMMNDQMNMQMMEKMRQEQTRQQQQQQRQQQMQQERQQQMRQRQGQMMDPQQQSQMPSQYMNRPPPEYKMQTAAQPATFTQNGGSLNPLQTMQNMVDQTGGYGIVKSEVPTPQPQNGASIMQMSAMQQSMSAAVSGNTQTAQATRAGYMVQHIQRPPSYPGQGQGQPPTRPQQPPSTYTSAILRNQRPPNVNVGPDGLNISQPRSQGHEWPRPMMPGGQRPPMQTQTSMTQQSAAMMQQYNQYPPSTQSMAPGVMHMQRPEMNAMQNQNALMPNGSATVMMQQQSMQMSQQHGVMRPNQPGSFNMANSAQMPNANSAHGTHGNHGTHGGYPSSSTQDDFMNFLDNAQNSNSDIFDSLGHASGTTDFNLLDEILGK